MGFQRRGRARPLTAARRRPASSGAMCNGLGIPYRGVARAQPPPMRPLDKGAGRRVRARASLARWKWGAPPLSPTLTQAAGQEQGCQPCQEQGTQ